MSDIIYTPPASGGGGTTINPTNDFIPVRFNATSFKDSFLRNTTTALESQYIGVKKGIYLNFANQLYSLGDYNLATNGTMLVVDENNETISTKNINEPKGLLFDYNGAVYKFGDFNNYNNGSSLIIDDTTNEIYTKFNGLVSGFALNFAANSYSFGDIGTGTTFLMDSNNQYAAIQINSIYYFLADRVNSYVQMGEGRTLVSCNLASNFIDLGDVSGIGNQTTFTVDDNNEIIVSRNNGNDKGILIDFANTRYYFGDFNGINKTTYLYIEDPNQTIHFYTDVLDFNGASLQSGSSSGSSGQHLVITLNGSQYKIDLKNP